MIRQLFFLYIGLEKTNPIELTPRNAYNPFIKLSKL